MYLLASSVLKSSMLTLWKSSISHVFTRFCTFSSSDPAGHTFNNYSIQNKFHRLNISICMSVCVQINRDREKLRSIEMDLGSPLFEKLVNNIVVGRCAKLPFGVLLSFCIQMITILVSLNNTGRCHAYMLASSF